MNTGHPLTIAEKYQQHSGDPVQNMLAPYVREIDLNFHGVQTRLEYVSLADAYVLLKRALEIGESSRAPEGSAKS